MRPPGYAFSTCDNGKERFPKEEMEIAGMIRLDDEIVQSGVCGNGDPGTKVRKLRGRSPQALRSPFLEITCSDRPTCEDRARITMTTILSQYEN